MVPVEPEVCTTLTAVPISGIVFVTENDPTIVWRPAAPEESDSVRLFRFVKASRPTVPDVPASETVQEELVTLGTVYEPVTVLALIPNARPLLSANVMALSRLLVVPALTRIFEIVAALDSIAVVRYAPDV